MANIVTNFETDLIDIVKDTSDQYLQAEKAKSAALVSAISNRAAYEQAADVASAARIEKGQLEDVLARQSDYKTRSDFSGMLPQANSGDGYGMGMAFGPFSMAPATPWDSTARPFATQLAGSGEGSGDGSGSSSDSGSMSSGGNTRGPDAAGVLYGMFDVQWNGNNVVPLMGASYYIGTLDLNAGYVSRNVGAGAGLHQRFAPADLVKAAAAAHPNWSPADWDAFFLSDVGSDTPGGETGALTFQPEGDDLSAYSNPITRFVGQNIVRNFVDDKQLAAGGGLTTTLLITVQVATEITATLDPIPISDVLNATALAAQGDYKGALIVIGGAMVPGALDKLAGVVKHLPASTFKHVEDGLGAVANKQGMAAANIIDGTPIPKNMDVKLPEGHVPTCTGGTCFVAGTLVIAAGRPPMWATQISLSVAIEDEGPDAPMETRLQDLAGVALIGAGAVIYMRRRNGGGNSERRSRRRAWRRGFGRHIHVPAEPTGGVESVDMMAMVPPTEERDVVFRDYDLGMTEAAGYSQDMPAPSIKPSNQSNVTTDAKPSRRPAWMRGIVAACLLMMGGLCLWPRATELWSASETTANAATSATVSPPEEAYPSKRIEDVRAGDWVLAREEHGERQGWKQVAESYRRTAYHLRHLTFQDANGHTQTLQTTDEHPFWSVTAARFVDAGNLHPGDLVTSPDGHLQTLSHTDREEHPAGIPVFNFQVAEYHTYYANAPGPSATPLLVHNSDKCILDGAPKRTLDDPLPPHPKKPTQADPHAPDPEAIGPHTVLGTRTDPKKSPAPYRQGITYDADGNPLGRTDVTTHGRGDHPNPHYHPYDPTIHNPFDPTPGNFGPAQPIPN